MTDGTNPQAKTGGADSQGKPDSTAGAEGASGVKLAGDENIPGQNTSKSVASVQAFNTKGEPAKAGDKVRVKFSYPKDFKGQKFYKDGDIETVSHETALHLVEAGIATYVDQKDKPADAAAKK